MNNHEIEANRYQSFCGIQCDSNANQLIAMLEKNINEGKGDKEWQDYFTLKRALQIKLKHDNLHFIGNQTNTLYEYFEQCQDEIAMQLLYQIEQECC